MTTAQTTASASDQDSIGISAGHFSPYDRWMDSIGVPIYRAYYIEDLRTIKLGRWEAREADAAFVELEGQQGVTGAYVLEIGPGQTIPSFRVAVDECIYVLEGRGLATIQGEDGSSGKSFEWQKHSLFLVPSNHPYQLSNAQGNQRARLLVSSYLPLAMSVVPNPDHFFKSPIMEPDRVFGGNDFYSEATVHKAAETALVGVYWVGNFFPDLRAWDKMDAMPARGAGGRAVMIEFPRSPVTAHMSVFPPLMYKKGHRHGPGYIIVIPVGEGYSLMWPEGGERIEIPWHEGSCFVPPFRWFHQHFNVSERPDRYLAIHPPRGQMSSGERIENRSRDQIEHPDEDPWIREKFEKELAKRGLKSRMPDEAYKDYKYDFGLMKEF